MEDEPFHLDFPAVLEADIQVWHMAPRTTHGTNRVSRPSRQPSGAWERAVEGRRHRLDGRDRTMILVPQERARTEGPTGGALDW